MIFEVLLILLILSLLGFYFLYYEPKKRIQKFAKEAQNLGYKVKLMPFQFMKYYLIKFMRQDDRSLQIFKEQLKNYDLIVGNMITRLAILPVNLIIIKDIFNQLNKLPKNPFYSELFQLLNGGGIVFSDGQTWKRKRRIMSTVFHFDFLNQMIPTINQLTEEQFKQIDKKIKNNESVNLLMSFSKISSSVVAKCFFGTDMSQYKVEDQTVCEFLIHFLDQISQYAKSIEHMVFRMSLYKFGLTHQCRQLRRKIKIITSIARQITQKQLENVKNKGQSKKNLLTTLYQKNMLNLTDTESPNKYRIDQLIGQFVTFFAAGTDTTSHATNLALHYLSQNSQYVEKINQQLESLKNNKQISEPEKLKNMKWVEAIFNETLRINGPASGFIPRIASQQIEVGCIKIPKNTSISLFSLFNHYKQQNFQKPFEFLPERWIQNNKTQSYAFLPFGGGERNCIGQYLARIQGKIFISKMVQKYVFKSKHPIKMQSEFIYCTKYGDFDLQIKKQTN